MAVTISEISDADLEIVSSFLNRYMNEAIPAREWHESLLPPWDHGAPHHGYQLRDDGRLVGVYTAIFSERTMRGRTERFCNLGTWCVLPDYRFHSLGLLKKLLDMEGYHFTDLSPKPDLAKIMRRLEFTFLDTSLTIMPNIPWPQRREGTVIDEASEMRAALHGDARRTYDDHANLGLLRHLVVAHGGETCHIIYLRQHRKRIPCAIVLHIGAPQVLARCYRVVARYFLARERCLLTIFESRFLSRAPVPAFVAKSPDRNKLYRSETLTDADIDNLYSELLTLARQWLVERPRKD